MTITCESAESSPISISLCHIFVINFCWSDGFPFYSWRAVLLATYLLPIGAVCLGVSEKGIHIVVGRINTEEKGSIDDNDPYQVQRVTEQDT